LREAANVGIVSAVVGNVMVEIARDAESVEGGEFSAGKLGFSSRGLLAGGAIAGPRAASEPRRPMARGRVVVIRQHRAARGRFPVFLAEVPPARRASGAIVTFLVTEKTEAPKLPPAVRGDPTVCGGVTYVCLMSFLFCRQDGDTTRTKATKIVERGPQPGFSSGRNQPTPRLADGVFEQDIPQRLSR
jgi:hypothetical protein